MHRDSLAVTERKDKSVSRASRVTQGSLDQQDHKESKGMTDHKDSVAIQGHKVSTPACLEWHLMVSLHVVYYCPYASATFLSFLFKHQWFRLLRICA